MSELQLSGLIPFRTDVAAGIIWIMEEEKQVGRTSEFYKAKLASIATWPKKSKRRIKTVDQKTFSLLRPSHRGKAQLHQLF